MTINTFPSVTSATTSRGPEKAAGGGNNQKQLERKPEPLETRGALCFKTCKAVFSKSQAIFVPSADVEVEVRRLTNSFENLSQDIYKTSLDVGHSQCGAPNFCCQE